MRLLPGLLALGSAAVMGRPTPARPAGDLARSDSTAEVRRLDVLIVLYTRSFSRSLSREQLERVHEEVLEFVDFYRAAAEGAVEFRISLLQIDRELPLAEVSEVAPGRYYLSREDIEAELTAYGMRDYDFDEVIALYAWNNANPDGASLAYGGGAVGPDGRFLGDAGYNAIGVFAWDPGRISQIMIHEVLHNLDDMFSMSGMPEAFLNADEMSRNMSLLLRERPGAFRPQYDDDEMADYAKRELANRATYPWSMQLIYYGWMLQRTPRDDWLRLKYGEAIAAGGRRRGTRPLYDRIFVSRADREVYLPVVSAGTTAPPVARAGAEPVMLEGRTYEHTDFDGTVLFEGNYYAGWIPLPAAGGRSVDVTLAGGAATEVVRIGMGELAAPSRVVSYASGTGPFIPAAPPDEHGEEAAQALEQMGADSAGIGEGVLVTRVREARFGGDGPLVESAEVTATVGDDTLRLDQPEPGRFVLSLAGIKLGRHRVVLRAEAPGLSFVPRPVEIVRRYRWSIYADSAIVEANGTPIDLRVRIARDVGVGGARITARVSGRELELREVGDGRYGVVIDKGLAPGLDTIRVRAELTAGRGTEVLERDIPVYVEPRGWIEVPPRIGAVAGTPITLEARVRDRMGRIVKGAHLPIAVVAGPELLGMTENDASGVYTVGVDLPPGDHRLYVIGLMGRYERRVIVVQVDR